MQAAAQAMPAAGESNASARTGSHERTAVAMALAESQRHSAQLPKMPRAGREAREVLHGHVPGAPLTHWGRPAPLSEAAGWQERVERHFMEGLGKRLPVRADSRSPCAAYGGHSVGVLSSLGLAGCRAGYRSTQGLLVIVSFSGGARGAADCGTVGGSTYDRILLFAPAAQCRADR